MAYGEIEYDGEGNPICEVCGKGFSRLLSHVSQKHGITQEHYRIVYGYNRHTSFISERQRSLNSLNAQLNMDKIKKNLEKGKATRFKKGNRGRPKELLSHQGYISLRNAVKNRSKK